MAGYIGQPAVYGRFRKLDSIAASFNGVTTSFALTIGGLSYIPSNALQLLVVVNGVVKEPGVDYTVNGSNLVFAVAPTGGQSFHAVLYGDTGFLPVAGTASYVTEAAQPNITSVGTLTTLGVSGTVTASKFTSNVATGTAPFTVTSTTQVANLNAATSGTASTVTTAAQPNITSVGNLTIANVDNIQLDVNTISTTNTNGNLNLTPNGTGQVVSAAVINGSRFVSNVATGTAPLTVTSTTQVANLNAATAGSATTAGTVTTAAQPNITSVGTLSTLTVTGNVNTSASLNDSAGNARDLVNNAQSGAYQLAATDNGKMVNITTGGITVPNGVFGAGNNITVFNNSASSQTITQGASVTMYLAGTATTGNRTLAQRGIATVVCVAANTFVISGGGLT